MDTRQENVFVRIAADNIKGMLKEFATITFTHAQLAELLETRYRQSNYYNRVNGLKAILKKDGWFFETLNGVGYKVAETGKEINICETGFKRGFKRMARAVKDTNYINYARMDDAKRTESLSRAQRMANLISLNKHSELVD